MSIRRFVEELRYHYKGSVIRKNYVSSENAEIICNFKEEISLFENYEYKDEKWNYIHNLYQYRKSIGKSKPLKFDNNICNECNKCKFVGDNVAVITSKPQKENWICFYYKDFLPDSYTFSFEIKIESVFKEIQIAFKYANLGNRLRFIIRNNREVCFECVSDGEFYNKIHRRPISLVMGKYYKISVTVNKEIFSFTIDDMEIFRIISKKPDLKLGNKLSLILYNPDDDNGIFCLIKNAIISI